MNIARLSAAGSGKTWGICSEALNAIHENETNRVLMVTYTNRGVASIKEELVKQNNGFVPCNVVVMTWYQFLLKELIRPYQIFLPGVQINEIQSYYFDDPHGNNNFRIGTKMRYITTTHDVRSKEASELVIWLNKKSCGSVFSRFEKVYTHVFFDEVQDFTGRDIDILESILKLKMHVVCVGDNKQATFKTHYTKTNYKKSGKNIFDFFCESERKDLIKIERNLVSRRFNADICSFANRVYSNENNMTSCMNEKTNHDGVFLIARQSVMAYYNYFRPQELRFDKRTIEVCSSNVLNYGECKGMTFDRCLIYPAGPLKEFILKGKVISAPEKYYVAVTRAKYSNTIILDKLSSSVGFKSCTISLGNTSIPAMCYVGVSK